MLTVVQSLLVVLVGSGSWQSYTNTNFINSLSGTDSSLVAATNGGILLIDPEVPAVAATIVNSDGLPANKCVAACRDDEGNIWVGTDGGGVGVVPADSTVAFSYRPNDLTESVSALNWHGERLLVGTDRGLYVIDVQGSFLDFDDDIIRHYSVVNAPELLSDRVLSLAVDDSYWIGTNLGVTAVDTGFGEWVSYRSPMGDSVKAIARRRDELLVGTEKGIAVFRDTAFAAVLQFPEARGVYDLEVSGADMYLATDTGVFYSDTLDASSFLLVLEEDARSLYSGQRIWVGLGGNDRAGSGLRYSRSGQTWSAFFADCIGSALVVSCAFDPVLGDIQMAHFDTYWAFSTVDPLTARWIRRSLVRGLALQLDCDSYGRTWLAHFSSSGGLTFYDPPADSWGSVQWGQSSSWNIIDAFGIDANDTKWVYNAGNVVVAVDSAGEQVVFDIPGLVPPPEGGYDFAFDSRGKAWLGLTVGLVEIDYAGSLQDQSDDSYTIHSAGLPAAEVRSVDVDVAGDVWAATSQGVAVWDGTRFAVYAEDNSGLLSDNVYRVRTDASGRVWFLCDNGLSLFDPVSNRWTNYTPQNSGLLANHEGVTRFYTSLAIDSDRGIAAIGTQRGLSVLTFGADSASELGSSILVYPNPCVLGTHLRVVVDSLPESAKVDVRTLAGRIRTELDVDEGLHRAVWEPENVASGVYLVVVHGPKGRHVERVAIVCR